MLYIVKHHGYAFLALLGSVYVGTKGIAATVLTATLLPYFKLQLHLSNYEYQTALTIVMLPWALKSILGLMADRVRCFNIGHHTFFAAAAFVGSACAIAMAALPHLNKMPLYLILALTFGISLQVAFTDLLSEGMYAKKIAAKPETGTAVLSAVYRAMALGSLAGTIIAALCSTQVRTAFGVVAVMCVQCALPLLSGIFKLDPNATPQEFMQGLLPVCFVVSTAAIVASVCTVFASVHVQIAACVVALISTLAINFYKLPSVLACCNAYMFLANVLNFNFAGPLDFWYTAPNTCVRAGPAFTVKFYIAVGGVVGAVFSMLGIELYKRTLSTWNPQRVFQLTALLRCAAAAIDVIILNRWNIDAGVPDSTAFVLGKAMLDPVIAALDAMPMVALTAKLCPEGNETSVYALLASYQNFGRTLATVLGMAAAHYAGVHLSESATTCTYAALPTLIVVCNMLLPLLCVPLTFILPSKKLN